MAYDQGIQTRAIELFLELQSIPKVHVKICKEYEAVLKKLPSEITIRKWIEKNEVPEVLENMKTDSIAKTRAREIEQEVERKERDLRLLDKIRDKAANELEEMEYTSAMEATKAIDMSINSSRKITNETVNLQFIEDVLGAITNIIVDETQRRAIGIELRKIFQKYSTG